MCRPLSPSEVNAEWRLAEVVLDLSGKKLGIPKETVEDHVRMCKASWAQLRTSHLRPTTDVLSKPRNSPGLNDELRGRFVQEMHAALQEASLGAGIMAATAGGENAGCGQQNAKKNVDPMREHLVRQIMDLVGTEPSTGPSSAVGQGRGDQNFFTISGPGLDPRKPPDDSAERLQRVQYTALQGAGGSSCGPTMLLSGRDVRAAWCLAKIVLRRSGEALGIPRQEMETYTKRALDWWWAWAEYRSTNPERGVSSLTDVILGMRCPDIPVGLSVLFAKDFRAALGETAEPASGSAEEDGRSLRAASNQSQHLRSSEGPPGARLEGSRWSSEPPQRQRRAPGELLAPIKSPAEINAEWRLAEVVLRRSGAELGIPSQEMEFYVGCYLNSWADARQKGFPASEVLRKALCPGVPIGLTALFLSGMQAALEDAASVERPALGPTPPARVDEVCVDLAARTEVGGGAGPQPKAMAHHPLRGRKLDLGRRSRDHQATQGLQGAYA